MTELKDDLWQPMSSVPGVEEHPPWIGLPQAWCPVYWMTLPRGPEE